VPGFVKVGRVTDVPKGSIRTFEVNGKPVLVVNSDGKYYAMGAICKHEGWDLSEGTLADHKVTCAGHGAIWDFTTGTAEFEEPLENEPLYAAKVEGEDILVGTTDQR
jgi:nitrite reductase/ring-hydroxylating ferredoxin subunit